MSEDDKTTTITTDAPPAPAEVEEVELTLAGLDLQDLEPADEPPAQETPAPPVPAAPAATTPTPEPKPATPVKGDVGKALKQERQKTKTLRAKVDAYERLWGPIEAQRAKGAERFTQRPSVDPVQVRFDKPPTTAQSAEAEKILGTGAGPVVDVILTEAHRYAQTAAQGAVNQALASVDVYIAKVQEADLRDELAEQGIAYDEVLQEAGMFDALKWDQGRFVGDAAVGQVVYGSPNWARKAYRLAEAKLRKAGKWRWDGEEQDTPADLSGGAEKEAPTSVTPTPAPTAPQTIAEARREGARQVAEAVVKQAERPRGIRVLQNAGGPPRTGLTPEFWDRLDGLMDSKPEAFIEFMQKNPAVDTWFMRGRPS